MYAIDPGADMGVLHGRPFAENVVVQFGSTAISCASLQLCQPKLSRGLGEEAKTVEWDTRH